MLYSYQLKLFYILTEWKWKKFKKERQLPKVRLQLNGYGIHIIFFFGDK